MKTHYLIDHNYDVDKERICSEFGHLLAFSPGPHDADLTVTIHHHDREPERDALTALAGQSSKSNYGGWPVEPVVRFAIKVESSEPIVCQSTIGWNNTLNNYLPDAKSKSARGVRGCAKSVKSITRLSRDWYLPDGTLIGMPDRMYVRESEWAALLNPGDEQPRATLALHCQDLAEHRAIVPPSCLRLVYVDSVARRNFHSGAHFHSDQPIAVQWWRAVNWNRSDELMAYRSVPGPLE